MKLPLSFEYIHLDEEYPQAHCKVKYMWDDTAMHSIPIKDRRKYLLEICIEIPKPTKKLITLVLLLHELGHIHYKTYLYSKYQISPKEFMKQEYLASSYVLRGIKERYHEEALKPMAKAALNHTKQFLWDLSVRKEALTEEYHKKQILKYYRRGIKG